MKDYEHRVKDYEHSMKDYEHRVKDYEACCYAQAQYEGWARCLLLPASNRWAIYHSEKLAVCVSLNNKMDIQKMNYCTFRFIVIFHEKGIDKGSVADPDLPNQYHIP